MIEILPKKCLKASIFLSIMLFAIVKLSGQNSMTGDGFGGRSWYVAHNYQVGAYSAYTVCDTNNQLYGWGGNSRLELAMSSGIVGSSTPYALPGMAHIKFYTTGYLSAAIKMDNTAWVWGDGVSYSGFSDIPVHILDNVKFVDGGSHHAVFVKSDSTVWGIGSNFYGELGNGTTSLLPVATPVQMIGINTAVRAVALGYGSGMATLILMADGTCKLTGGDVIYTNTPHKIPTPLTGLTNIVDIKGGANSAFALTASGQVYAFGTGYWGSLGIGQTTRAYSPVKIVFPNGAAPIVALSANNDGNVAFALDENGNVYGWGDNRVGQLGINFLTYLSSPLLIDTNAVDIFAGESFSYLLKADNSLWATGQSGWGGTGHSIWMNLNDSARNQFTQINPSIAPMYLCMPRNGGVFPITLKNFVCTRFGKTAKLIWNTENEKNFSRFILEYSSDGKSFESIATIFSRGSGSSYTFQHTPLNEVAFYRLKMVDKDGVIKYSDIRSVKFDDEAGLVVSPNPTINFFSIDCSDKTIIQAVHIYSLTGSHLKTISCYSRGQYISLLDFKPGTYVISVIDKNGKTYHEKIVKL